MGLDKRKEFFTSIVGSHNYNLNTSESDKDYKVFLVPSFDDLYNAKYCNKDYTNKKDERVNIDYNFHDIRKMKDLFFKSNVNFLEVLFSVDIDIGTGLSERSYECIEEMFLLRDKISKINLPYLYDACLGMYHRKREDANKPTPLYQYLYDKHGYNTKAATTSIRMLFVLDRFKNNDFTSFKDAIWFNDKSFQKQFLLGLKNGNFSYDDFIGYADTILRNVRKLKTTYYSFKPDLELYKELDELVKIVIKEELFNNG